MSTDFCTLPRKKLRHRILSQKQRVLERSLQAVLLEARRELVQESEAEEEQNNNTYVAFHEVDNIYEELNFSTCAVKGEDEFTLYEEIL